MAEENDTQETTEGQETDDLEAQETPEAPAVSDDSDEPIQGKSETQPVKEESFISPNELPDELKPHWKRMHRAYTKRLEEIKSVRDKAAEVDRFHSDPSFAYQTLAQWAVQNGYALTPTGAQAAQQPSPQAQASKAPPQLVEAVRAQLAPELQWMAEGLANSQWAAQQMLYAPILQRQQQDQRAAISGEYEQLANELSQTAPGWEEHESEMTQLFDFLQSSSLKHPRFGSKLQMLYNMLNGNASALAESTNRMNRAVKNRSSSSTFSGKKVSNLSDRIRKASSQDAWRIATQAALGNSEDE